MTPFLCFIVHRFVSSMIDRITLSHALIWDVVFGELDALLFNALLEGKSQCSASRAVSLKLGVAALGTCFSTARSC